MRIHTKYIEIHRKTYVIFAIETKIHANTLQIQPNTAKYSQIHSKKVVFSPNLPKVLSLKIHVFACNYIQIHRNTLVNT
jgi:hypothetical protein